MWRYFCPAYIHRINVSVPAGSRRYKEYLKKTGCVYQFFRCKNPRSVIIKVASANICAYIELPNSKKKYSFSVDESDMVSPKKYRGATRATSFHGGGIKLFRRICVFPASGEGRPTYWYDVAVTDWTNRKISSGTHVVKYSGDNWSSLSSSPSCRIFFFGILFLTESGRENENKNLIPLKKDWQKKKCLNS